jgi:hypothetical protein
VVTSVVAPAKPQDGGDQKTSTTKRPAQEGGQDSKVTAVTQKGVTDSEQWRSQDKKDDVKTGKKPANQKQPTEEQKKSESRHQKVKGDKKNPQQKQNSGNNGNTKNVETHEKQHWVFGEGIPTPAGNHRHLENSETPRVENKGDVEVPGSARTRPWAPHGLDLTSTEGKDESLVNANGQTTVQNSDATAKTLPATPGSDSDPLSQSASYMTAEGGVSASTSVDSVACRDEQL